MQVIVRGSFYRDWKELRSKELSNTLLKKLEALESASDSSQIPGLKKLRIYKSRYKIEVATGNKIYWMLCILRKNKIELLRIKAESYFKKKL